MAKFLKDNGLSVAFFALFALCLVGQVLTGYALQSEDPAGQTHTATRLGVVACRGREKPGSIYYVWLGHVRCLEDRAPYFSHS